MFKLTKKQNEDIETILFFGKAYFRNYKITRNDIQDYLNYSERGIYPRKEGEGFELLNMGKKYRDVHMQMWEDGIMDGSVPYYVLLGGENKKEILPYSIVNYMKKALFGGIDNVLIEKIYQEILNTPPRLIARILGLFKSFWRRLFYLKPF